MVPTLNVDIHCMRAEIVNLCYCAVPFLSRAGALLPQANLYSFQRISKKTGQCFSCCCKGINYCTAYNVHIHSPL